jgi:hypothetical protein
MELLHEDGRLRGRDKFSVALERGVADSPAGGDLCLLIANGNGVEGAEGQYVSHLGRARNTGAVTSFDFRVSVTSLVRLDNPILTSELADLVPMRMRAKAVDVLARRDGRVPRATGVAIGRALVVCRSC